MWYVDDVISGINKILCKKRKKKKQIKIGGCGSMHVINKKNRPNKHSYVIFLCFGFFLVPKLHNICMHWLFLFS